MVCFFLIEEFSEFSVLENYKIQLIVSNQILLKSKLPTTARMIYLRFK